MKTIETLIIGGGLSGLYAACLLTEKNSPFILIEARERIGGRILSVEHQGFFTDLGPSWYWPEINPKLNDLIQSLGLQSFDQFEEGLGRLEHPHGLVRTVRGFATEPVSWRVSGGMQAIVDKLAAFLPKMAVRCNNPVCEIEKASGGALVRVGELGREPMDQFRTHRVILAIPPRLAAATILFTPDLSHHLTQAMLKTGTWMAGQAKFFTLYETSCWREKGLSGQAFSQRGPLGEIHDGSNQKGGPYGLTGFLGMPAFQRKKNQPLDKAIFAQLASIYGDAAGQPTAFYYQDWAREKYTATEYDQPPMHEHPLYQPPAGHTTMWDGIIHFAGSETAHRQGGYLEGALVSAQRAVENIYPP